MQDGVRIPGILVVRPGALGDTILSVPLVRTIQRLFPGSLTFLGNRSHKLVLPSEVAFQPLDHPDWLWLFQDEVPATSGPTPRFGRAYVVLERPEPIVSNLARTGTGQCFTVGSRPPAGIHVVEHLHQRLALPVPPRQPALRHLMSSRAKEIIWVHPGSGSPKKCVPVAFISALARGLQERLGWDVAITAGEEDGFLKEDPVWNSLVMGPRTHLLERQSLHQVCTVLGGASLYIGNDSGISHLAAGLGVPCVIFFVTTDPRQWAPWAPRSQVIPVKVRDGNLDVARWVERVFRWLSWGWLSQPGDLVRS